MENPFNALTALSVKRPKATIASIIVITLALSSMAQFINFDNSEDAFYPQNDTTELLYEIEDRYQASLDFIRIIDEIEQGEMKQSTTWEQFANIEAELATNELFLAYQEQKQLLFFLHLLPDFLQTFHPNPEQLEFQIFSEQHEYHTFEHTF